MVPQNLQKNFCLAQLCVRGYPRLLLSKLEMFYFLCQHKSVLPQLRNEK